MKFKQKNNLFHFYTSSHHVLGVIGQRNDNTNVSQRQFQDKTPIYLNQVHGKDILLIEQNDIHQEKWNSQNYDGVITSLKEVVLVIKTADCIPILFWQNHNINQPQGKQYISALHCGWRSVAKGILKELATVSQQLNIDLESWNVCLAPGIQSKNYPVDKTLKREFSPLIAKMKKNSEDFFIFSSELTALRNKTQYHFDLKKMIIAQLLHLGFAVDRIHDFNKCTYQDKALYSHRENKTNGRNLNFIHHK